MFNSWWFNLYLQHTLSGSVTKLKSLLMYHLRACLFIRAVCFYRRCVKAGQLILTNIIMACGVGVPSKKTSVLHLCSDVTDSDTTQ